MELRHLRYFLAVADTLNFSRAAERIRVAQPALSRQIHDLEEELGFKLFERTTSQVRLTEAGRIFRRQTENLFFRLDLAVTGARRIAQGAKGELRIGSDWNASALPITSSARELQALYPGLAVDFVELPEFEHRQAILDSVIDIGFVAGLFLTGHTDVDSVRIHTCAMKAILPQGHRLANASQVRLRDLREERWIAVADEEIPGFKAIMTRIVRPARFAPKFGRTARSLAGLLAFVGTGEGIGLVPEMFLPPEPEEVCYRDTDCAPFEMFAVWSKDTTAPTLLAFVDILRRKLAAEKMAPATLRRPPTRSAGKPKASPGSEGRSARLA